MAGAHTGQRSERLQSEAPGRVLPLLALATGVTGSAVLWFLQRPESDFLMFYESGRAWLNGAPPYRDVNSLSPPTAVVSVFALISLLPYDVAKLIWTVVGAVAVAASIDLIRAELRLNRTQTARMVAVLGVTYAAWGVWFQGQILWLLLYPCTRSWAALRNGKESVAGLWLVPVIALKPQFALLALVLPLRVLFVSAAGSILISAVTILVTGWAAWADWLAASNRVYWLSWADNASLWGAASRLQTGALRGGRMADLPMLLQASVVAAAVTLGFLVRQTRDVDCRFTLSVLWTVLVSPLGWVHYLPLCLGPATASWPRDGGSLPALVLLSMPLPLLYPWLDSPMGVNALGNIYTVGVGVAWFAWHRTHQASGASTLVL